MPSNAEVVRRIYDEFTKAGELMRQGGNLDGFPFAEIYDPEVVLDEIDFLPGAKSYRGYEGLAEWFSDWLELYDDIRMQLGAFVEAGDKVLVSTHQSFRSRAGVETEQDIVHVWTLRDGRVVHITGYADMAAARAAAGLDG